MGRRSLGLSRIQIKAVVVYDRVQPTRRLAADASPAAAFVVGVVGSGRCNVVFMVVGWNGADGGGSVVVVVVI